MTHYVQHGLAARVQRAQIGNRIWDHDTNLYVSDVAIELIPLAEGKKPQKLSLAFRTSGTADPNDDLETTLRDTFAQGAELEISGIAKNGTRLSPTTTKPDPNKPIIKVTLKDLDGPRTLEFFS